MIDKTPRNLLLMQLECLQRWRRDAWDAWQHTLDRRCHAELIAADEAVAKVLQALRDLIKASPAAKGLDL